jgi:hypothetical protein
MAKEFLDIYKDQNIGYADFEEKDGSRFGSDVFRNVKELQVGSGNIVFRADQSGIWLGAARFADAPFSVDMDGHVTADSITLTGFIPTGGALTDIGAGNITNTYIGANAIATNNIIANAVVASKIATDAVTASKIEAGAVTATKINVSTLSAISANVGTLTSGTITGVVIQTGTSGKRVRMSSSTIKFYDSSDTVRVESGDDGIEFFDENGDSIGEIYAASTFAGASDFIVVDVSSQVDGSFIVDADDTGITGLAFDGDIKYFFTDTGAVFEENLLLMGDIFANGSGSQDIGDSSDYFGEINYKTLVDRGCLGWYDEGVEMRDGTILSDIEALKAIKLHDDPKEKTPAGARRLDYRSMPKHVYVQAFDKKTGKKLPRDENDKPYKIKKVRRVDRDPKTGKKKIWTEEKIVQAQDGAETTALLSIMLGAIKELDAKIEAINKTK